MLQNLLLNLPPQTVHLPADGDERLLEVVRADVEREEVEALDGRREHARLGVHALARVHRARAGGDSM